MRKFVLFILTVVLCFSFCFLMPTNKVKADENVNLFSFNGSGMFFFENQGNCIFIDESTMTISTYSTGKSDVYFLLNNVTIYRDTNPLQGDNLTYMDISYSLHESNEESFYKYFLNNDNVLQKTVMSNPFNFNGFNYNRYPISYYRFYDMEYILPPQEVGKSYYDFFTIDYDLSTDFIYRKTSGVLFDHIVLGSQTISNDSFLYGRGYRYNSFISYCGFYDDGQEYSLSFRFYRHFNSQLYTTTRTYWLMHKSNPTYYEAYSEAYRNILSDTAIMNDIRNSVEQTVLNNEYQRGYSAGAKVALSVDTALTDVAEVPLNMVKDFIDFDVPIQVDSEGNVTKVFNLKNIVGVALAFAFLIILLKLFLGGVTK